MSIPTCGRGTFNGAAAEASKYGFAPCTLAKGHSPPCDSGPAEVFDIVPTDVALSWDELMTDEPEAA
jgi:hypothetical protein